MKTDSCNWAAAAVLSIIVLTASSLRPAEACAYHGTQGGGYAAARPHANYVALAMSEAMQQGTLASPSELPVAFGLMRLNGWLRDVAAVLHAAAKASNDAQGASFALLVADAGLWSRYRIDRDAGGIETHVDGPGDERVVVITGEAVLAALTTGQMGAAQAVHKGLIAIVGPDEDVERVTRLLASAL